MLNPPNHSSEQPYTLLFLKQLIRNHPLACLSGLWVSLVLLGGVATVGLLNPSLTDQERSSIATPTLETVQESTPQSTSQQDLPLAWIGAVVLGCAGGSFLVTQALKKVTEHFSTAQQSKPVVTVRKKTQHLSKKRRPLPKTPPSVASHQDSEGTHLSNPLENASSRQAAPLMRTGVEQNRRSRSPGIEDQEWLSPSQFPISNSQFPATRFPTPNLSSSNSYAERQPLRRKRNANSRGIPPIKPTGNRFTAKPTSPTLDNRPATTAGKLTYVTVLPPEESHPLDGREESLADQLDLRKHHSLTSLMRGKSLL